MSTSTLVSQYSHMALNLSGVILLLFVLLYGLKKVKSSRIANNRHIKIINSVSIGAKERIILMEVNNITILVGATPNHIDTLHVFNDAEAEHFMRNENMEDMNIFSNEMAALKYSE